MAAPALILLVRFKSRLPLDEVMRIVEERAPENRDSSPTSAPFALARGAP